MLHPAPAKHCFASTSMPRSKSVAAGTVGVVAVISAHEYRWRVVLRSTVTAMVTFFAPGCWLHAATAVTRAESAPSSATAGAASRAVATTTPVIVAKILRIPRLPIRYERSEGNPRVRTRGAHADLRCRHHSG